MDPAVPPLLTCAMIILLAMMTLSWLSAKESFEAAALSSAATLDAAKRTGLVLPTSRDVLLDPRKTIAIQGHTLPLANDPEAIQYDEDVRKPTVDGSENAPRSLAMFSYNQCSLECCPGVGGKDNTGKRQ
jgi:hypothetical protein